MIFGRRSITLRVVFPVDTELNDPHSSELAGELAGQIFEFIQREHPALRPAGMVVESAGRAFLPEPDPSNPPSFKPSVPESGR